MPLTNDVSAAELTRVEPLLSVVNGSGGGGPLGVELSEMATKPIYDVVE